MQEDTHDNHLAYSLVKKIPRTSGICISQGLVVGDIRIQTYTWTEVKFIILAVKLAIHPAAVLSFSAHESVDFSITVPLIESIS